MNLIGIDLMRGRKGYCAYRSVICGVLEIAGRESEVKSMF